MATSCKLAYGDDNNELSTRSKYKGLDISTKILI